MLKKGFPAVFVLFLIVILFAIATPARSEDPVVFAKDFAISDWHLHLSYQTFNSDNSDEGVLTIQKTTPDKQIDGGFVLLNGQFIFLRDFLTGAESEFMTDVELKAKNHLAVFLRGPPGASIHLEISIKNIIQPPEVTFSAVPKSIALGDSSTLAWGTKNVDSCTIEPDIGSVAVNGSFKVSPTEATTYTLTATGPGGSLSAAETVTVTYPPPEVSIGADKGTIEIGQSTTVSWISKYAASCAIAPGIGNVERNGSRLVSPTETTTYTITAANPGGNATDSVTVTVNNPNAPPTVNFSVTPPEIEQGGSATLSWTSYNGNAAHIDNGIGAVEPNGSIPVSPEHTTTYTLTVTGPTGSTNARAVVTVLGNQLPQPEGSFGEQYADLIPVDATVEEYDHRRFSLITGLVQDSAGAPIADVSITIHNHPEYGTVITNAEGRFSIPVEGGGNLTVVYQKEGLITSHRKVYVPWNDIAIAEAVQMITEDPVSTTLTFDGNPDTVVTHQSTPVADEFGSRSASMVFTGDNRAYLVDENGNDVIELTTISTRATEYTTPESMPAKLPPNSAYTFCVELAVDGAQNVRFEKPVIIYVDNFLGFDVGMAVPVGYYDRNRGVWVPSDNGVVVKLLDTNADGRVDALDANGDDQPDDLDNNGSFSNEVQGLEDPAQYVPGATFWRAAITHFTPWDCNWPYGPPEDAISPNPEGEPEADDQYEDDCKRSFSSYIEARSRIFHEDVLIPGTNLTLHYAGNRVRGYQQVISVPASGDTVPVSLKQVLVRVEVAGKIFEQIFDPLPNQTANFIWDGLDHLGELVLFPILTHASVGFVYDAVYLGPGNFARAFAQAGNEVTGIRAREEIISWKRTMNYIYPEASRKSALADGWTISNNHHLAPSQPWIMSKGDGTVSRNHVSVINTIAGNGTAGYSGNGGPATKAKLNVTDGVAVDAAGNVYIADSNNCRIRKVDTNGIITTVAGTGSWVYSGDGGPAIFGGINHPDQLAVDASGNIYITDYNRIRKVDTNGIITTVAGTGSWVYSGDGGPATAAGIDTGGVAVGTAGNLYISDNYNNRIRKVDTNGIITTVAGNGVGGYGGDGGLATEAKLKRPTGVAVDAAGNIYICDNWNRRIRKVDTRGIITTVAGNGVDGYSGDGGPATAAKLSLPNAVAVDAAGNIYIADQSDQRIRKVDTRGIITTVAGNGVDGFSGDGGPATAAMLNYPTQVAVDAAGNIYIADQSNDRIRKVASPAAQLDELTAGDIPFVEDIGLGHIFSSSGIHKMTVDLDTGVILRSLSYDEDNNLYSISDQLGNTISIERDVPSGVPTAIISPDGIRTELAIDTNNHLTQITYPDGSFYGFEYTPDGLMTAEIEPEGNRFEHDYTEFGRLTDVYDEEGGHWNYQRTASENGSILAQVASGEGNLTTYLDYTDSTSAYTSTITDPTGVQTLFSKSADGLTVNKSLPCSMDLEFKYDVDSEYKFKFVTEMTESTPSGLERITLRDKTYEDTDSDDTPDLITKTFTVNGKTTNLVHNTLQTQKTITSPDGRTVTSLYDPNTLLTESVSIPGLYNATYGYDSRGRLTSVSTNTRQSAFTYNAEGFLDSITDPETETTYYTYDLTGRVTSISRPDGSFIDFDYDANGNMTVLAKSETVSHGFGYNRVNRNDSYQTPLSGSYSWFYDKDRRLTQKNFPSGKLIKNIYDTIQLKQVQTPEGNIDYTYLCNTKVESITKAGELITYGYDGRLVTSETINGALSQTIGYSYNNDFDLTDLTYAGTTTSYAYDNDGLFTGAGNYTITRNAQNGLPESVAGGTLSLSRTFNGYGEVNAKTTIVGGQSQANWSLNRDNNGRIIQKTETVNGVTANYGYTYDSVGRLLSVTKDSTLVEEYQYHSDGTRSYEMNSLRGIVGRNFTYSDEDHLLSAGSVAYNYDLDGFLTTKTDGSDVTSYSYSSRGELLSVTLPDGRVVEYVHDPLGRRIAKKVNGSIVEKYLWQRLTRLLAVYDSSDTLLIRFEYADERVPVAMVKEGVRYYLIYDQVGSLRVVADAAGNVVKSIEYDSFGNIINDSNPTFAVPFGFAGGLHDRDTGLVRFGYRDYDPDVGRWTAKDPVFFAGGDTDLYGYVLNDPVNKIDPLGLTQNPFPHLPTFTEAFPMSNFVAPVADIIVGGIEAGFAISYGVGGVILLAHPVSWVVSAALIPTSFLVGWDAYGRLSTGLDKLANPCE